MRFLHRGRESYLVSIFTYEGGVFVFWSLDRGKRQHGELMWWDAVLLAKFIRR